MEDQTEVSYNSQVERVQKPTLTVASFGLSSHCHTYADNAQLYIYMPASESQTAAAQLATGVEGLDQWMGSNRLKLNAKKTELIWIGTGQQLAKLTITQLQLINSVVEFDNTATNLGVVLNGQPSMFQQVAAVFRSSFYQLRQLKSVKSSPFLCRLIFTVGFTTATMRWLEWPKFIFRNFSLCRLWPIVWCLELRRSEHITPVLEDVLVSE